MCAFHSVGLPFNVVWNNSFQRPQGCDKKIYRPCTFSTLRTSLAPTFGLLVYVWCHDLRAGSSWGSPMVQELNGKLGNNRPSKMGRKKKEEIKRREKKKGRRN